MTLILISAKFINPAPHKACRVKLSTWAIRGPWSATGKPKPATLTISLGVVPDKPEKALQGFLNAQGLECLDIVQHDPKEAVAVCVAPPDINTLIKLFKGR